MIPETFAFIADLTAAGRLASKIEVLVEIHSYYLKQIEIAKHVDRVYDFALPPLISACALQSRRRAAEGMAEGEPAQCRDGVGYA